MICHSSVCYVDLAQLYSNVLFFFVCRGYLINLVKMDCVSFLKQHLSRYSSCILSRVSVSEDPVRFSELESYS